MSSISWEEKHPGQVRRRTINSFMNRCDFKQEVNISYTIFFEHMLFLLCGVVFLLHVVWSSQHCHPLCFPLTTAAGSPGWLSPSPPCGVILSTWALEHRLPSPSTPGLVKSHLFEILPPNPFLLGSSSVTIGLWLTNLQLGQSQLSWHAEWMAAFPKETLSKGPRRAKDIFSLSKILKHWSMTSWEIVTLWLLKHHDAFSLNFVETLSHKNPKTYCYSVLSVTKVRFIFQETTPFIISLLIL